MKHVEALAKIAGYELITGQNEHNFERADLLAFYNDMVLTAKLALEKNPLSPPILRAVLKTVGEYSSVTTENLAKLLFPATMATAPARPKAIARQLCETLLQRGYLQEYEAHLHTHYRLSPYGKEVLHFYQSQSK